MQAVELALARDADSRDTGGEPRRSRGPPAEHVARVVDAEVEAAHADGDDQQRGRPRGYTSPRCARMPAPREHEGEHPVADQGAHRVSAREAEGVAHEEAGAVRRTVAVDDGLEDRVEDAAAGKGGDPPHDEGAPPLPPEDDGAGDGEERHRRGRAELRHDGEGA
jgi:hypothetical protein